MSISIKIDHVAVMVSDVEKSLQFYRDLLGLEVVSPEEHKDGPISEMTAMPRVHMREYRLRAPGAGLRTCIVTRGNNGDEHPHGSIRDFR